MDECRTPALRARHTLTAPSSNVAWQPWRACQRGRSWSERRWRSFPLALLGLLVAVTHLEQLPGAAALKVSLQTPSVVSYSAAIPVASEEAAEEDVAEEVAEENAQEGAEEAFGVMTPVIPTAKPPSRMRIASEDQLPGSDQMYQLFRQTLQQQQLQQPQQPQQQEQQLVSVAMTQGYTFQQAQMYVQEFWQAFPQLQPRAQFHIVPKAGGTQLRNTGTPKMGQIIVAAAGVGAAMPTQLALVVSPRGNVTGNLSRGTGNLTANGSTKSLKLGLIAQARLRLQRQGLIVHQNEFDLKGGGSISLTNIFGSFIGSILLVSILIKFAVYVR